MLCRFEPGPFTIRRVGLRAVLGCPREGLQRVPDPGRAPAQPPAFKVRVGVFKVRVRTKKWVNPYDPRKGVNNKVRMTVRQLFADQTRPKLLKRRKRDALWRGGCAGGKSVLDL